MPGDWKRDPQARAELAADAAKHGASKRTARTPATPEYQILAYNRLADLRAGVVDALEVLQSEIAKDGHALLKRLVAPCKTIEDFQTLTKCLHDLARVVEVTLARVNFPTAIGPAAGSQNAAPIDITPAAAPAEDRPTRPRPCRPPPRPCLR